MSRRRRGRSRFDLAPRVWLRLRLRLVVVVALSATTPPQRASALMCEEEAKEISWGVCARAEPGGLGADSA